MKKISILILLVLVNYNLLFSQVAINNDGSAAATSAMLDVKSTSKGLLPPRMTHVQMNAIVSPANGLIVYCTDCGITGQGTLCLFMAETWYVFDANCLNPLAPVAGIHLPLPLQIVWNWNSVYSATGYKWNTTNDYATATDMVAATTKTETGLNCNTDYTRFAWAYSACGNSTALTMNQTTSACLFTCGQPITDSRDGKSYNTVQIGDQCWMAQNLNVGTKITVTADQTNNSIIEKYCFADDDANCAIYGGLYQWNELMDYTSSSNSNPSARQGICPTGWHLPSDPEFCQMVSYLDETVNCAGTEYLGADAGGNMKETGTTHWTNPNTGATNSSGFTALGGGIRDYGGYFSFLKDYAFFWTATENSSNYAWTYPLHYTLAMVGRFSKNTNYGISGRCIKDNCTSAPNAPSSGIHIPMGTEIVWNWNTVSGATGYKWNTTNVYTSATDMG
ncbi:MAG: FISUMP domain-containing protein, partial [Bacteroidota bacterium]